MNRTIVRSLLCLIAVAGLWQTGSAQATNTGDSLALVDLYNSTNGPNWFRHDNWLTGPVSTWFNVRVNNGRVVFLSGSRNNLAGTLPASIGNLTRLSRLGMDNDTLTGTIPASIGRLVNLTYLNLGGNQLSGSLTDSIGNLTKLTELILNTNQLSGAIPASIGNLSALTTLELDFNQFSGRIPSALGKLQNCYLLELGGNQLSGTIPDEIGNMSGLQLFDVFENNLTGSFPASFSKLKKLTAITAYSNHLTQARDVHYLDILPELNNVLIYYNNFNFNGLESLVKNVQYVNCNVQAPLPLHATDTSLSVSAGGTLSNNTYYWYRVGSTSSPTVITGDSVFHPAQSGSYYAQITNAVVTRLTLSTDTVSYTAPAARTAVLLLSLSPVPARDRLTVSGLPGNRDCRLVITDAYGNVWLTQRSSGQAAALCDVSRLKPGAYTLSVAGGSSRGSARFMKQ